MINRRGHRGLHEQVRPPTEQLYSAIPIEFLYESSAFGNVRPQHHLPYLDRRFNPWKVASTLHGLTIQIWGICIPAGLEAEVPRSVWPAHPSSVQEISGKRIP